MENSQFSPVEMRALRRYLRSPRINVDLDLERRFFNAGLLEHKLGGLGLSRIGKVVLAGKPAAQLNFNWVDD